jgi:hypothetical protein
MAGFGTRIFGALRLDAATYEDVEHDPSALGQATIVVVVAGAATGVAQMPDAPLAGLAVGAALGIVGWVLWACLVGLIGARWLAEPRTEADGAELLRTLGFAAAPGVLRILGIIQPLATPTDVVAGVWTVLAMIVAVRQVLDFSTTWRAVAVCTIGWATQVLVLLAIATVLLESPKRADSTSGVESAGSVGAVKATGHVPAADDRAP